MVTPLHELHKITLLDEEVTTATATFPTKPAYTKPKASSVVPFPKQYTTTVRCAENTLPNQHQQAVHKAISGWNSFGICNGLACVLSNQSRFRRPRLDHAGPTPASM